MLKPEIRVLLQQNLNWIFLSMFFFLLGIIIAYAAAARDLLFFYELSASQQKVLHDLARLIFEGSPLRGIFILFLNNFFASVQMMLLGILLGIPTLLGLFTNGTLVGSLAGNLAEEGVPVLTFLSLGVLPHGVFELPAFFISAAFGLKLGFHLVFPMPNKKRGQSLGQTWREYWSLLPLIIYLLITAAIIEVLLTPYLLKLVFDF